MESPTLIANSDRSSGRFGSKRFYSLFFPKSDNSCSLPANAQFDSDNSIIYPDEAFHHGITFEAKLIGVMDIPRPQSRMEIVAAMRKVRFDHKTKGIGKRKVDIRVSIDGVKVTTPSANSHKTGFGRVSYDKLDNLIQIDQDSSTTILQHPIHRIFYVSHDSQDLNVFSYMARENRNDYLRCVVFKAKKKTDAMQIVKTIGQAFDVCHEISSKSQRQNQTSPQKRTRSNVISSVSPSKLETSPILPPISTAENVTLTTNSGIRKSVSELCRTSSVLTTDILSAKPLHNTVTFCGDPGLSPTDAEDTNTDVTTDTQKKSATIARVRLDYELQKGRVATSQINFLKSQLASETAARVDAQNRIDELLRQNAMLLDVIENLLAPNESMSEPSAAGNTHQFGDLLESAQLRVARKNPLKLFSSLGNSTQSSSSEAHHASGSASSPDSGFKSTSSFNLRDDETY